MRNVAANEDLKMEDAEITCPAWRARRMANLQQNEYVESRIATEEAAALLHRQPRGVRDRDHFVDHGGGAAFRSGRQGGQLLDRLGVRQQSRHRIPAA